MRSAKVGCEPAIFCKDKRLVTRTTSATLTFRRPFLLEDSTQPLSAGPYIIDAVEELADAPSFPVWRRVSTVMRVARGGATEHVAVDPQALQDALRRDGEQFASNDLLPANPTASHPARKAPIRAGAVDVVRHGP